MSSPAPIGPRVLSKGEQQPRPAPPDGRRSLLDNLGLWKQVFLAELLNLLEHRRYDLK